MTAQIISIGDRRLREWKRWCDDGSGRGPHLAEIRSMERTAPGAPFQSPEAEEIERLLCDLKALDPEVYHTLLQRYDRGSTDQEGAKWCHCGPSTFQARIQRGLYWLAGAVHKSSGFSNGSSR